MPRKGTSVLADEEDHNQIFCLRHRDLSYGYPVERKIEAVQSHQPDVNLINAFGRIGQRNGRDPVA